MGGRRIGEVSFSGRLLHEQKIHISSAERERGREEGSGPRAGRAWHSHGRGFLCMVSWGPDDGKTILKRCRQRDGDDRQIDRQGGHRRGECRGDKHTRQGREHRSKTCIPHARNTAAGHVGRKSLPLTSRAPPMRASGISASLPPIFLAGLGAITSPPPTLAPES